MADQITFITRFDAEPEFWQFLSGLTHRDIITELIQNELDADSTKTTITFGPNCLSCVGDGEPIDGDGWKRLSFVRGAGHEAPRKRGRIGVKNHGLKTCFTLGDEIVLRSGGKIFKQTLYSDGPNAAPRPGTYPLPSADPEAPSNGCNVRVPYRTKVLVTQVGEPLEFSPPTTETIAQIFESACQEIPRQFIGCLRPGIRERYTIVLCHHAAGTVTYSFRCTAKRRLRRGWIFGRTCTVSGNIPNLPSPLRESVFDFVVHESTSTHEIPDFFKARNGFHAEIAWRINSKGAPRPVDGHLRYPIAYVANNALARTGLALNYSGPFISDQERHGATGAAFNTKITELCDDALIELLRCHLLPKHGPKTLELLIAEQGSSDRLRSITEILLAKRAIPLSRKASSKQMFGPQLRSDGKTQPVVVPSYTWASDKIEPVLQFLCPGELDQVDSDIPKEFLALLAHQEFPGWKETHVTFDEADVLNRMQPVDGEPYFPWRSDEEWQKSLGDIRFTQCCLDVLAAICEHDPPKDVQDLKKKIYLPDTKGNVRPMNEMFVGNELPSALGILGIPPLLSTRIAAHPLFRRRSWRLQTYSLNAFLESSDLNEHPDSLRRVFFEWMSKNRAQIPVRFKSRLGMWAIWPDRSGSLHKFESLCLPRNPKISDILADSVHLPSVELIQLLSKQRGHAIIPNIRTSPSPAELEAFYSARLSGFPEGQSLTEKEILAWRQFEANLDNLAQDKEIASWLRSQTSLGLARDKVLRPLTGLHSNTQTVSRVSLLDRYMLDRPKSRLDEIFSSHREPTLESIVQTLLEDPARPEVLIPRLKALEVGLTKRGTTERPVEDVPCIPYNNKLVTPSDLAFKGNRGDYWGKWKLSLSGKGLSADEQKLYRLAGVTSSEPDEVTSLAFFQWLNQQQDSYIQSHIESIVRHFVHARSVRNWWDAYDNIPCLLVEIGACLRLVTRRATLRRGSQVFIPDFEQLADVIRADSTNDQISLAVISHPRVSEPITAFLRECKVQSLRATAAIPIYVRGVSPTALPSELEAVFQNFRSAKMDNLRKRLSALEFPLRHLREDWKSRLDKVQRLEVAEQVIASFKVARRIYPIDVKNGFDEEAGTIWLKRDADLPEALFEALALRVFREDVPKFAAAVLQTAVRWEYREATFPLPAPVEPESPTEDSPEVQYVDTEPGETLQTHRPSVADPTRNFPHPGPIPQTPKMRIPRTYQNTSGWYEQKSEPTPFNELEATQIEDLKENQYAWHCQVCLTERSPAELAPSGSYVALAENRRMVIEAEHADQKHAGGARNAGNLILLCHFHHHQLGNALSRELLTEALRRVLLPKQIEFRFQVADQNKTETLDGYVVSVCPPSLGTKIDLFFTSAHRDYWLRVTPSDDEAPLESKDNM
jgi:hypothetical protein